MQERNPLSIEYLSGIFRTSSKDPTRIINREGTTIEFKESYNHAGMAQYFKTIAAFANNSGGYIIFGVGDKPRRLIGLKDKSLAQFEDLKVEEFTKNLMDYFSPEIKWDHCTFEYKENSFGVIYVFPLKNKPCICKKQYDSTNNKYSLNEGDIFYRYGGRSEKIHYTELSEIIDEQRRLEEKQWIEFAKKTSQIGIENACLLDMNTGSLSGNGKTIVIEPDLLEKITFIKEGEFVEVKGKPTLRLIGDIEEIGTGRIVFKETTKKVVRAIEATDILDAFFNGTTIEEPLEYIKAICFASSANYPVYFLIKQSNKTITEIIDMINVITSRGVAKKNLLTRLNGKFIIKKGIPTQNTSISKQKQEYRNLWLDEKITLPVNNMSYCLDALLMLDNSEIEAHEKYIKSILASVVKNHYESASSGLASLIRIAICRIDEALDYYNGL